MKAKKLLKQSIKSIKENIKTYERWAKNSKDKLIELEKALEELK